MSAIAELRRATWPSHQRLEKRINFKARLATLSAYRAHIEQMWGFYVVIEPGLTSGALRDWL
jgi:heme oxygenase